MARNLILSLLLLCSSFSFAQTILDKIKTQAKEYGMTHIKDSKFELQDGGMGSLFITLAPGDYKIFGLGGYSEVKDIDLYIYNEKTEALIAKESDKEDGITILNITLYTTTRVWIKVYNMKSAPDLEYYDCYLLITKE